MATPKTSRTSTTRRHGTDHRSYPSWLALGAALALLVQLILPLVPVIPAAIAPAASAQETDPGATDPAATDPAATDPGAADPAVTDPDSDADGIADSADVCPGGDDLADADGDLTPDDCDDTPNGDTEIPQQTEPDTDGDGVGDSADLCPAGDDAADADGDLTPDACDDTPNGAPIETVEETDSVEIVEADANADVDPTAPVTCATAGTYAPSIWSDLPDYAPGSLVTLMGEGWVPGQTVNILVDDDGVADAELGEWHHDAAVTADPAGAIFYQFNLPNWFVANYTVAATGECTTASTAFTDGNVKVASALDSGQVFGYSVTLYENSTTCAAGAGSAATKVATEGGSTTGVGGTDSLRVTANLNATTPASATFSYWTTPANNQGAQIQFAPGFSATDRTVCIVGFVPSSRDLIGHYIVNRAPVATNGTLVVAEDSTANPVSLGATDPDNNPLTYTIVSGPANGTLSGGTGANRTYTPNANFNGTDSFTFKANDGTADSNTATVSILVTEVNDAPVAANDTKSTPEDTALTFPSADLLANDSKGPANESDQTLTVTMVGSAASGTTVLNLDGSITYTPNANFNGTDTFTYTVSDNGTTADAADPKSHSATVTVTVTPVNDAPVAVSQSVTTAEDTATAITLAATDSDNDSLTYAVVDGPAHGTLSGTAPNLTYTPDDNYNGPDSFTFTANDGIADSNVATVSITVTNTNDNPVAEDDEETVAEDSAATAIDVLANDDDGVDTGETLAVTAVGAAAYGTVGFTGTGVTYAPAANFNGEDSFTYTISDGNGGTDTATVDITVTAVNDAPVAVDDAAGTDEDTAKTFSQADLKGNDTDIDNTNAQLSVTAVFGAANGTVELNDDGSVTFTPAADFVGTAGFDYTVSDGDLTDTGRVTVTVTAVNDAPVAEDDTATTDEDTSTTVDAAGNDTDVDGDALNVVAGSLTQPANGTAELITDGDDAGKIRYTPGANFNGTDTFTYAVTDGTDASNTATVIVTVNPVNDAPSFTKGADQEVTEDAGAQTELGWATAISEGPVNEASQALDFDVTNDNAALFSVQPAISPTGTLTYTPAADANGSATVTVTLSDDGGAAGGGADTSAAQTFTITVTAVNDAPSFAKGADQTVAEDSGAQTALGWATVISEGPADESVQTVSFTVTNDNAALFLEQPAVAADGTLTYTPAANANGSATTTVTLRDDGGAANGGVDASAAQTFTITVNPVNDAPVAVDKTLDDAHQGVAKTVTLEASDIDSANLTFTITQQPAHGTLSDITDISCTATGSTPVGPGTHCTATVTYTANAGYAGSDDFTYKASDGSSSDSADATVTITVVNSAPVTVTQTVATDEDTATAITLAATDADSDALTYAVGDDPSHGTLSGTAPNLTYTPDDNYNGSDSFTFTANDGIVDSTVATVTITVSPVNDAPVASADPTSPTLAEDATKTVALIGSDVETAGSELTFQVTMLPSHGTLYAGTDEVTTSSQFTGSPTDLTYAPDANYNGLDAFTFRVTDSGDGAAAALSASDIVTITVSEINDAPVAVDDVATVAEDSGATTIDVLANDSTGPANESGQALTVTAVSEAAHGTVALVDGTVTYAPAADYNGPDSFTYTVTDNGTTDGAADPKSDTATVSVTVTAVNDAPVAGDDAVTTDEDTAVVVAILVNDTDVEGDALSVTTVSGAANGTVVLNDDGTVTFTPAADFNGTGGFDYTVGDGDLSDTGHVTVTVTPVNDAPSYTQGDDQLVDEDAGPQTVAGWATDISAGPADESGQALDFVVSNDNNALFSGQPAVAANGTLTYTPAANANGSATVTVKLSDNGGTANGGIDTSSEQTFTIDVTPVNDAPVAVADTATTAEDTGTMIDVVANDTDVEDDSLSVVAVSVGDPEHGAVVLNADGTITYTPDANYHGGDAFAYTISDGNGGSATATVTITVTPVNDAPVAVDGTKTVAEDSEDNAIILVANDVDGDALTYAVVSPPANGSLSGSGADRVYTPNANFFGTDTFTFTVNDGSLDSNLATVTVTVTNVNDDPVAADDAATVAEDSTATAIDVLANDSDGVDAGETLTVAAVGAAAHGTATLNPDGSVTYAPDANYYGPDSFTYTIGDGNGGTATATVTVTVAPVNDAPVAANDTKSTPEDTVLTFPSSDLLANDSTGPANENSQTLTVVAVTATAATHGTVVLNDDGTVTFAPAANYNGPATFGYTVRDNGGGTDTGTATVNVTVSAVNDAPVAGDDTATTNEDTGTTIAVVANDTDIEGDALSVTAVAVTADTHGAVEINPDGTVTYAPAANYNGPATFTYTVSDGLLTDTGLVTVEVTAVNDAPVAADQSVNTAEDTAKTITLAASDVDSTVLTYAVIAGPAHGTLSAISGNTVTYTPDANYHGADSFTFEANDGSLDSNEATVSIDVTAVNDAPVAVDDPATTDEDASTTIDVVANDTDVDTAVDGDILRVTEVFGATNGTVTLNPDGTVTFAPAANFNGTGGFDYTVEDGNGGTDECHVTVTVTPVNDAPVAVDDAATVAEDGSTTVDPRSNDTDVEGDALTVTAAGPATNGTVTFTSTGVTYTPDSNYNGGDAFAYTISDGNGGSATATVTITVTPVNDAPVVDAGADKNVNEGASTAFQGAATDVDGDPLTYSWTFGDGGTASGSSVNHTYVDGPNDYTATLTVTDGVAPTSDTVDVHVNNVAPVITNLQFTVDQSTRVGSASFDYADAGTNDGQTVTFTYKSGDTVLATSPPKFPANGSGSVSDSRQLPAGCYTNVTVTVTITDKDGGSATASRTAANSVNGGIDLYTPSFQAPIKDNERNLAKAGNVVPLKVALISSCSGTAVTTTTLYVEVVLGIVANDAAGGETVITTSVSSADTGTQMRVSGGGYIYNLSTKSLKTGQDYTVRIRMGSSLGPIVLTAVLRTTK